MIQHFKCPGNPRFESKLNGLVDGHNTFINIRGDDTFIDVQKIPGGGLKVSLNLQQVIARIPKQVQSGPQQFIVTGHPNMSGGVMFPYVWAQTVSNVSQGTMNQAVGVIMPHDIGDTFLAFSISQINYGGGNILQYQTSNGATGVVTWMEEGSWGTLFTASCNQSGGTNGSASAICSYTYIMGTKLGVPLFTTPQLQQQTGSRIFPMALQAANQCIGMITPTTGQWTIVTTAESTGNFNCNASGGAME